MGKKLFVMLHVVITFICLPPSIWADAPNTTFHIPSNKVEPTILKDAIGILGVDVSVDGALDTFEKSKNGFKKIGKVCLKDTEPLATFGYHPSDSELLSSYYPITSISGAYVEIVVDCVKNKRVWINDGKIKSNRTMLDTFVVSEEICCVDLFYFRNKQTVEVYPTPSDRGSPTEIEAKLVPYEDMDLQPTRYRVLGIKENFLKVEGVGWVRIRDGAGSLIIWPIQDSISAYPRER